MMEDVHSEIGVATTATATTNFPISLTPQALGDSAVDHNNHSHPRDPTILVWDFTSTSTTTTTSSSSHEISREQKGETSHVHIYLKTPLLEQDEQGLSGTATTTTTTTQLEELPHNDEQCFSPPQTNDNISNNNDDDDENTTIIEASVLQYQRQLRKSQAAKRAGATVTPDQLDIVYQDDAIVVVNKPAGVLCVPGIHNNDSIANLLFDTTILRLKDSTTTTNTSDIDKDKDKDNINQQQQWCPDACSMAVHRLDMDTSGLVVYGKTKRAVSTLHQAFRREHDDNNHTNNGSRKKNGPKKKKQNATQQQQLLLPSQQQRDDNNHPQVVTKEYEALVCGHLPLHVETGTIELPLQRDVHHPPFMRVSTVVSETLARQVVDELRQRQWTKLTKRNPKPSTTLFRVLGREYLLCNNNSTIPVTRLSLTPITGRTHQLRVHCAAIGFPIVGDPVYGLYGESAMGGGLYHNPIEVKLKMTMKMTMKMVPTDNHAIPTASTHSDNCVSQSIIKDDHATSFTTTKKIDWRAPILLQKQLLQVYPPGEKPMCLHAKRLGIPHPIMGEFMEWQVSPAF